MITAVKQFPNFTHGDFFILNMYALYFLSELEASLCCITCFILLLIFGMSDAFETSNLKSSLSFHVQSSDGDSRGDTPVLLFVVIATGH